LCAAAWEGRRSVAGRPEKSARGGASALAAAAGDKGAARATRRDTPRARMGRRKSSLPSFVSFGPSASVAGSSAASFDGRSLTPSQVDFLDVGSSVSGWFNFGGYAPPSRKARPLRADSDGASTLASSHTPAFVVQSAQQLRQGREQEQLEPAGKHDQRHAAKSEQLARLEHGDRASSLGESIPGKPLGAAPGALPASRRCMLLVVVALVSLSALVAALAMRYGAPVGESAGSKAPASASPTALPAPAPTAQTAPTTAAPTTAAPTRAEVTTIRPTSAPTTKAPTPAVPVPSLPPTLPSPFLVAQSHKNALPVLSCGGIGCTLADPTSPLTAGLLAVVTKLTNSGFNEVTVSSVTGTLYASDGQTDTQVSSAQLECESCSSQTIGILGSSTFATELFIPYVGASASGTYTNATLNELLAALRSCSAAERAKFKLQGIVQTTKGAISLLLPLPCATG
jgi:hypothetical protein